MTSRLDRYRRTHHGPDFPLPQLHDHLSNGGRMDAVALDELGRRFGMPPAAIRAAHSFYDELRDDESAAAIHICHGTSCLLAGADSFHESLARSAPCRSVYCLGYCDRSPAVLDPQGRIATFDTPASRRADNTDPGLPPGSRRPPSLPSISYRGPQPIVTERIARGDFSAFDAAWNSGVYRAVKIALSGSPDSILRTVEESGERGRGGAGFPTGLKWRRCAEARADEKFVIANGDEGDPGSFIDRVLMEHDPHAILAGMICAAHAVGARHGIVFIRGEYPDAVRRMRSAVEEARTEGLLGPRILGRPFAFDVTVFAALGSYVCGEETAMLNAIEGRRGEVRLRPPYPADEGLFGKPTVVNNVETLVNVAWIIRCGAARYRSLGTPRSAGTKAICLNAGFASPGIVEVEFGHSLRDVIESAGPADPARPIEAVILGGPMGSILTADQWDVPICYDQMASRDIRLGHGGLVAIPAGADWRLLLCHWLRFMRHESCGKCVPCRLGSAQALRLTSDSVIRDRRALDPLMGVMEHASLCAFGQLMPGPMRTILRRLDAEPGDRRPADA